MISITPELLTPRMRCPQQNSRCKTSGSAAIAAIALYNRLKNDIYAIYANCPLLSEKYVKATTRYLDDFYETINSPKDVARDFGYPCDENNTGNVIIKGLKEQY